MKTLHLVSLAAGAALTVAFTLPTEPVRATATGTVSIAGGTQVLFDGEKPEIKPLEIEASKQEGCGKVDTRNESLILSEKGGIANVVVQVEVAGAKLVVPEKPIVLDQKTCRFEPHVMVVPAGVTVEYHNSDDVGHNVHTFAGKNDSINKTIQPHKFETQKLDKEDRIEIKCDIHPWMNSWLVVSSTPFYAVTDAEGAFKIEGLPAGEHKAKLWHEKLGKVDATIKVGEDGKVAPIDIKMSAEKKAGGGRRK